MPGAFFDFAMVGFAAACFIGSLGYVWVCRRWFPMGLVAMLAFVLGGYNIARGSGWFDGSVVGEVAILGLCLGGCGWAIQRERMLTSINSGEVKAKHRTILERFPLAIAWTDASGNIEYVNPQFTELFGYALVDIPTVENWFECAYPNPMDRAQLAEEWRQRLEQARKGNQQIEPRKYRVSCKDGGVKRVEISGTILGNAHLVIFQDITEQLNAEKALRESDQMFTRVFRGAPVLMSISDLKTGVFFDVNEATPRISGFTKEEVIGRSSVELGWITPENRERLVEELQRNGRIDSLEVDFRAKDGHTIVGLVSGEQVFLFGRDCLLIVIVDITERKRAEEQLQDSLHKLDSAQEIAHIGFWNVALPGLEMEWSQGLMNIFGLPVHDSAPTFEAFLSSIHEEDRDFVIQMADKQFKPMSEPELRYIYRIVTADGKTKCLEHIGRQSFDDSGQLVAVSGSIQDATERYRVSEELQKTNTELQLIFKNMINAFIVWESVFDENGKYVSFRFGPFNDSYARISGLKYEDVKGRDVFDVWPTTDPHWVEIYGEVAVTGIPKTFEMYHEPTQGWAHCNAYRPTDSPSRVCVIFEDITERKQSEEMQLRLNRELHAISDCNQTLLRASDEQMLLDEICRLVCEEAGYRMAWVGYAEDDEAKTVRPVAWAGFEEGYLRDLSISWAYNEIGQGPTGTAIRTGNVVYSQDFETDPRMGLWREGALSRGYRSSIGLPLKNSDSRVLGALTLYSSEPNAFTPDEIRLMEELAADLAFGINVLRSRNELKQAEEEVRNLNRELELRVVKRTSQLEAANSELEAFSYSVSHDLRAPLRHIDGFVGMLQEQLGESLDEESKRYMSTITRATKRMGVLIDDLLSFARMARHELSKQAVNLEDLVREIIEEMGQDTEGRNVHWQMGCLPVVLGDRALLRTVMDNLVANALKFTRSREQAEIEFGSRCEETETIVFVRDNGVGFDPEGADKLFGVFQRLHSANEYEGTGIGLANVRRIIYRHGGRTWAESSVDQGATFYISLPVEDPC